MYKENPKTKGSGIICAIPQIGTCPNNCDDCFFQSGRSYLEPLDENLPNMPSQIQSIGRVVRVNDGNDSNIDTKNWIMGTDKYPMKFFNTAIPENLEKFQDPVVLTINPTKHTDRDFFMLEDIPENLMFIRIRTNKWNIDQVVNPAIEYYSEKNVPIILTFMAYFDTSDKIPIAYRKHYTFRKRTLNSYNAITTEAWESIMEPYKYNRWVYSCGKIEGEKGTTACRYCGNCLREYFATMERLSVWSNNVHKKAAN